MRLAFVGRFLIAVDEHHVDAGERADIGDAGAHEAGAENADLPDRLGRHGGRPARALVELLHRKEQRADHRRRFRRAQDLREVPRLDPQRLIHRQLQTLIDHLDDRARGRIVVVGLAAVERVGGRPERKPGFRIDGPARQFEAVDIPRRLGAAAFLDPVLGRRHQIARRHHFVDELHRLGAADAELVALEQKLQRVGRRQHARDALRAAAAGKQADLDFRQAEPRLVVVGNDAVMAGERELEAAAHRRSVERRDPGLAAGLDAAEGQRELADLLEQPRIRRLLALRLYQLGEGAILIFQHGEVGAAAERVLAGGDDGALDGGIARDLFDDRLKLLHHLRVDDVHRAAGHVPGDERNAVGIDIEGEIGEGHVSLPVVSVRPREAGRAIISHGSWSRFHARQPRAAPRANGSSVRLPVLVGVT